MEVVVEDKQLSLAIGKKGQNVRLAAKLTGWRIDIKSEEEKRREVEAQFGALEAIGSERRRPRDGRRPRASRRGEATGDAPKRPRQPRRDRRRCAATASRHRRQRPPATCRGGGSRGSAEPRAWPSRGEAARRE